MSEFPPIIGFNPNALLEYPGKLVSVVYTFGCNFKCPYCYNKYCLFKESEFYPEDQIKRKIDERKNFVDGIEITGGEPLIHDIDKIENLINFIKEQKLLVKLDTNGSFPEKLEQIIEKLDYIAMDIKTDLNKYYPLLCDDPNIKDKILKSINLIKNRAKNYEFRITVVPGIVEIEDIVNLKPILKGSKIVYLQQFMPFETCLDPKMKNVEPYSLDVLENMKKELLDICNKVIIRKYE